MVNILLCSLKFLRYKKTIGGNFVNLALLDTAKQKYINGEEKLAQAFYERAIEEGIPRDVVIMRKITREYLLFPLDFVEASEYFTLLFKLKDLSKEADYKGEYIKALQSLLNLKKLFLREISIYYFSELAVCYGNSLIVKHIHELLLYLDKHICDITENDCYEIKNNIPDADMKKLKIELLKIKAFCLNILLSYSAAQDSAYVGTTYHAYTYDYGWYSSTDVSSTDNYAKWAVIKPRLNMIGLDAYYDEYFAAYKATENEIKKYTSFDSPKELRKEVTDMIEYKKSNDISDKEFYKIAKRIEKEDSSRQSYLKMSFNLMKLNPFVFLFKSHYKKIYQKMYGMDEVGSFELDTYFTRKKLCGVCDMISCGSHWSIESVRMCMELAGCVGIGVVVYFILAIAMKFGFYLPNITIEKH